MERDFQGRFSRSLSVLCACVVDLYLFVFIRVHSRFLSFICVNLRSSAVRFFVLSTRRYVDVAENCYPDSEGSISGFA